MRILLLEAAILIYSFTAAAFHSDRPSVADDPWGLLRLAIPVAAGLLGLLLRDVYTERPRAPHSTVIDVMVAFGFALATQAALSIFKPDLALPRWAPTQGCLLGLSLLAASRALFPPGQTGSPVSFPKGTKWVYLAAASAIACSQSTLYLRASRESAPHPRFSSQVPCISPALLEGIPFFTGPPIGTTVLSFRPPCYFFLNQEYMNTFCCR